MYYVHIQNGPHSLAARLHTGSVGCLATAGLPDWVTTISVRRMAVEIGHKRSLTSEPPGQIPEPTAVQAP